MVGLLSRTLLYIEGDVWWWLESNQGKIT